MNSPHRRILYGLKPNILTALFKRQHVVEALTLLLSYSLRDSEKSLALEIDIPQKGRYICST